MPYRKGYELFRMRGLARRYDFTIQLASRQCRYILKDTVECPGTIDAGRPCKNSEEYQTDRGTSVTIQFQTVQPFAENELLS